MRPFMLVLTLVFAPAWCRASCWEEAGQQYGIETPLLKAIGWKESRGWSKAVGPMLPDGNQALGVMQINTIHLPALAPYGIRRAHLFDACVSQKVGAWVLADCIKRFGSKWKAVGCYYAGPASKNTAAQIEYVLDVQRFYAGYRRQEQEAHAASAKALQYAQRQAVDDTSSAAFAASTKE
jgi:soluble lytic murein transglycosylase-like protein